MSEPCKHKTAKYKAEYGMGGMVLVRDYLKCVDCGAEYSLFSFRWEAPTVWGTPTDRAARSRE